MPAHQTAPNGPPLRKGRVRVRSYKPHSTLGCKTCKIRRVKCDEGKPACRRCTSTGRECDGYFYSTNPQSSNASSGHHSILYSDKHAALTLYRNERPVYTISPISVPSLFDNEQERRGFAFFRDCTCARLCSVFQSKFWERAVLQACQYEPAIRHAAVALGSLHESFELKTRLPPDSPIDKTQPHHDSNTFSLQQYIKAIKLLSISIPLKNQEERAGDVALIACILFVYFETLSGHHETVVSLIDSGIKIIADLQARSHTKSFPNLALSMSSVPYISLQELASIILRLDSIDTQLEVMGPFRQRRILYPALESCAAEEQRDIAPRFNSLDEARNSLENIRIAAQCATMGPTEIATDFHPEVSPASIRSRCTLSLRQWSQALDHFARGNQKTLDKSSQAAIHVLKMHALLMNMNLSTDAERALEDECVWDQWTPQFDEIVSHAEAFDQLTTHKTQQAKLGLDIGIICPLCFLAVKCRKSATRWRAVRLLRAKERQEGVWNSVQAAEIVENLIRREEKGLGKLINAEDVPRESRVGRSNASEVQVEGAAILYFRTRCHERDVDVFSERSWENL